MTALSAEAADFSWLLQNFVRSVPGVRHTVVVSADGLLMAMSDGLDRTSGDQLAAIVSGLASLTRGAARQLGGGQVHQTVVEMDDLFLFTTTIGDGAVLAVVAEATCDVGLVGYEMTLLVDRAEATMTPVLVAEMRAMLPVAGPARVGAPMAGAAPAAAATTWTAS
ncbi:MAG: roadblock/LC7 domain-containing protein [Actinomycetales bacterium]